MTNNYRIDKSIGAKLSKLTGITILYKEHTRLKTLNLGLITIEVRPQNQHEFNELHKSNKICNVNRGENETDCNAFVLINKLNPRV